jgi:hypothetical protein
LIVWNISCCHSRSERSYALRDLIFGCVCVATLSTHIQDEQIVRDQCGSVRSEHVQLHHVVSILCIGCV